MKVAAAHAVLRALGAEFRRFDDNKSRIPDSKVQRLLRYQYLLDINRLFYFMPLLRNMWIIVTVENPFQAASKQEDRDDLRITAYFPNLKEGFYDVDRNSVCPPVLREIRNDS